MAGNVENLLYDSSDNKDNFNSLLELYKNHASIFIAFIGAGISASIEGVPDLKDLYSSWCKKYGCSEESEKELFDSFDALYEQIGDKETFDRELFDLVVPKNTRSTSTHLEIARAFDCFVTTNYYDPIEDGFRQKQDLTKSKPEQLTRHHFVFPAKKDTKYTLTYLHGSPHVGFCILRRKDYQYFYPSLYDRHSGVYVLENSLYDILTQWTVIFLGSSIETHLRKFLQYLIAKVAKENNSKLDGAQKREVQTHYWITSDSEINKYLGKAPKEKKKDFEAEYFKSYKDIKIAPIIYTGGHVFIEDLCRTMAKLCEPRAASVAGDTYNPAQGQGDL